MGSQNLALPARALSAEYLLISTDYVFDGTAREDYDEFSSPNPINQYGKSKLAGERLAVAIWPMTYIVRTSWLFGHRPKNYVDRVLTAADKDRVVRMAEDQLESPTYVPHVVSAIRALIPTGAYGTYNATSLGACTRLEFARYVLSKAGRMVPWRSWKDPPSRGRREGRGARCWTADSFGWSQDTSCLPGSLAWTNTCAASHEKKALAVLESESLCAANAIERLADILDDPWSLLSFYLFFITASRQPLEAVVINLQEQVQTFRSLKHPPTTRSPTRD